MDIEFLTVYHGCGTFSSNCPNCGLLYYDLSPFTPASATCECELPSVGLRPLLAGYALHVTAGMRRGQASVVIAKELSNA